MPNAEEIFHIARQIPSPEARQAYLDIACANNAALREQVEALLAADAGAGEFLATKSHTATAFGPVTEKPGERIGHYKLLQLIGEGGFGSVFLAEQTEPVRRRVALKIIKLGMDTKQVIARFEAERQALAMMDHPHIARVLDGGATASGRPYFVMEYVTGDAITKFADAHKLDVAARLELFSQVCQAVQHAHTKGIIHRDLKPGNILVSMSDGRPFAKVIDFGIAKATSGSSAHLTDKTLFTEHRQLIGTPEYMSPEQAEGSADIDTRTDVYALGVLLYELLTGLTPFDGARLRSAAWGELQRIIKEEEPLAPSLRLSKSLEQAAALAAARQAEPDKLGLLIKGELDWIVLKAMDKDRTRRYESPSQLAADVLRHLSGEAVVAAPASAGYRLRKFVRRNKGPVVGVTAVILALAAGGSVAVWQWQSARAANLELADREAIVQEGLGQIVFDGTALPSTPLHIAKSADSAANRRNELKGLVATALEVKRMLQAQTDAAEWSAYTANVSSAQQALSANDYPEARRILERMPKQKVGWEHLFVSQQSSSVLWTCRDIYSRIAFSPGGASIAMGYSDGSVQIRDIDTGTVVHRFHPHTDVVSEIQYDSTGTRLVTASWDGSAQVWSAETGERLNTLAGHTGHLNAVSFNTDGTLIVSASDDGTATVWNADTGAPVRQIPVGKHHVSKARFSNSGTLIVTASDYILQTWDVATGKLFKSFKGHNGTIKDVRVSPDDRQLVSASADNTARVWDVATGNPQFTLTAPDRPAAEIRRACFSPDGKYVVAGWTFFEYSWEYAFEASTGKRSPLLPGSPNAEADSINYSRNGQQMMTTDAGIARLWSVDSGELLAEFENHVLFRAEAQSIIGGRRAIVFDRDGETFSVYNTRISGSEASSGNFWHCY